MELYFFRHGIAADREDPEYPDDRDRPLTEEGVRKTREAAYGLKQMDITFDRILTSPWKRAAQTAQILGKTLKVNSIENLAELEGDRSAEELITALGDHRESRLILVGHEPLLSQAITRLLCSEDGFAVDLKKAGAAAIEIDSLPPQRAGTLLWLLTPRQLRLIGK